jgi:hypothetical protein
MAGRSQSLRVESSFRQMRDLAMPRTLGPVCLLIMAVVGCASTKLASSAPAPEDVGDSVDEP